MTERIIRPQDKVSGEVIKPQRGTVEKGVIKGVWEVEVVRNGQTVHKQEQKNVVADDFRRYLLEGLCDSVGVHNLRGYGASIRLFDQSTDQSDDSTKSTDSLGANWPAAVATICWDTTFSRNSGLTTLSNAAPSSGWYFSSSVPSLPGDHFEDYTVGGSGTVVGTFTPAYDAATGKISNFLDGGTDNRAQFDITADGTIRAMTLMNAYNASYANKYTGGGSVYNDSLISYIILDYPVDVLIGDAFKVKITLTIA